MRSDVNYLLDNKVRLYILKIRDVILSEIKDLVKKYKRSVIEK